MSHSIMLMSMALVFVTVSALALPYPQDVPADASADELVPAIDDTVPLVLDEGDETVDGRHHYSSNNRRPAAYYNRPSYNRPASYNYRPAAAYNYRPAAGAYNSRPHNYGSAGHHTSGGYGGYGGHQSNSYYGYQSHHGTFGGLGWREGQKPSGEEVADVAAAAVVEKEPLVKAVEENGPGVVVFQQ